MLVPPGHKNILLLPTSHGLEAIPINTIVRIEAISNYSKLYFTNGKTMVVAKILSWFEAKLSALAVAGENTQQRQFIRIHRSHIVNQHAILKYVGCKVMLNNNDSVQVSRRKKVIFMEQWQMGAIA